MSNNNASESEDSEELEYKKCPCNDLENHDSLLRYGKNFDDHGIHSGMCIYCLMEDKIKWYEEWDSWGEVAQDGAYILQFGFQDEMDEIKYIAPRIRLRSDRRDLINIYNMGKHLAKSIKSIK